MKGGGICTVDGGGEDENGIKGDGGGNKVREIREEESEGGIVGGEVG